MDQQGKRGVFGNTKNWKTVLASPLVVPLTHVQTGPYQWRRPEQWLWLSPRSSWWKKGATGVVTGQKPVVDQKPHLERPRAQGGASLCPRLGCCGAELRCSSRKRFGSGALLPDGPKHWSHRGQSWWLNLCGRKNDEHYQRYRRDLPYLYARDGL